MKRYNLILLLLCATVFLQAKVKLPSYFTDCMVVQQNSLLKLPGQAKPGKQIMVEASWSSEKYRTKAGADGLWLIEIPTPPAGGPHTLTISDGQPLTLRNVMSGEVWFCSGQSNMEMPLGGWGKVLNYEKEIAEATYPDIRLLQVKKATAFVPSEEVEINGDGWQMCTPSAIPEFSAVAYFYARQLWRELNVPIGVIDCTWGGTPAEAWVSAASLREVTGFQKKVAAMKEAEFDKEKLQQAYQREAEAQKELLIKHDAGFREGTPRWIFQPQTGEAWKSMELPGYWEGKGLKDFDGVVWFQKEIEIPAGWEGKELNLSLGMIDDEDITYYNGIEIARGDGFTTPRRYTVPAGLLKKGKGLITVRVTDLAGEGGIHGAAESLFAEVAGEKLSLAGEWSYRIGLSMDELPPNPVSPESGGYPTVLYNAMVHPFTRFPIKGAIWYQGEANVGYAEQYAPLFQTLIADWRRQWEQNFPFYFVQLANFLEREEVQPDSKWAALREAQAKALCLENTGMAVTIDIGEANDIHPKNKQEVARRLAAQALEKTYTKNITADGPAYQKHQVAGNVLTLYFDREVQAEGITPKGLVIAGPDLVFHPATAFIRGKEIMLHSPQVTIPVAARYGWADNPECNLYDACGYPVAPFRTDK